MYQLIDTADGTPEVLATGTWHQMMRLKRQMVEGGVDTTVVVEIE